MKKTAILLMLCILITTLSGCNDGNEKNNNGSTQSTPSASTDINTDSMDFEFTERDTSASFNTSTATKVADGENIITIRDGGTYYITGKHSQIVVESDETHKPQIILENAQIGSENGPAIYIKQADKVFITIPEGTKSTLSDGSSYDTSYDNADGTIFSKADLTINGSGSLEIKGNYKCGVVSKDDLVIYQTDINIESLGTAVEGKDCVKLNSARVIINSGADGIKATNSEDSARGYVYIESGEYKIIATNDGIQAETAIKITGGKFNITTGGGSAVSSSQGSNNWGMWGGGFWGGSDSQTDSDTESAKALKSGKLIKISNGEFIIDSSDDSLHSNSDIEISDGKFEISSGDDGIHADDALLINGGGMTLKKSYEGLEATVINITNGILDITASDDGMNAAGGNDSSALGGRPGQNSFESDSTAQIIIGGGYTIVNASGDGIDSNGSINVNSGVLLVSGPENSGNGGFDYATSAVINGGTVVISGSSGMAQGFDDSSKQPSFITNLSSNQAGGTTVSVSSGNKVLVSFTPAKQYSNIVISTPELEVGKTYKINLGGEVTNTDNNGFTQNGTVSNTDSTQEIELTEISTGSSGQGSFGGGMGGMKPDRQPQGGGRFY